MSATWQQITLNFNYDKILASSNIPQLAYQWQECNCVPCGPPNSVDSANPLFYCVKLMLTVWHPNSTAAFSR